MRIRNFESLNRLDFFALGQGRRKKRLSSASLDVTWLLVTVISLSLYVYRSAVVIRCTFAAFKETQASLGTIVVIAV